MISAFNYSSCKEKILLGLLPFWTPQVPPLGIACLKSFLQAHNFIVKTFDANINPELRKLYNKYFDILRENMSEEKRGNFYNIGHEVLQNHLMAHINYEDETEYIELVKILIHETFYFNVDTPLIYRLNKVLDEFYIWLEKYITSLLEVEKPGVLGLSVYKGTVPASIFVFQLAKKLYPHIKTVMGGAIFAQNLTPGAPNFEFFLEKTKGFIDHLIIGEGEKLFLKLLLGELPESKRVFTLDDIHGDLLALESADIPDLSDLDIQFYPNLASYTSRSCPYQCAFCTETVYWGKYRKKNFRQIVDELAKLYETYNYQLFFMCDSLLNPVITGLTEELYRSNLSVYLDGYLKIEKHACDEESVHLWRRGGFYRARLGVESGSQRILDFMHKKVTIQQVKTAITLLADAGIKTTTYWIIGYPGETEDDFQKTLDLIEELKDCIYEAECNPFGYYLSGQVNSDEWIKTGKPILLYPDKFKDLLILQSWILDCKPSREEVFSRLRRFSEHCQKLGISNPYSLYDIYQADERWKKLNKNAVPSLVEFRSRNTYIDECKRFRKFSYITGAILDDTGFSF